jgi:ABC-type phosphonate transport system ATPase subunit
LSSDLTAWKDLSRRFGGRFFCGLFMQNTNDGLRLEAPTIAAIGDRGLALDFDIYAPDNDPPDAL